MGRLFNDDTGKMMSRKKILWLASWYPNALAPYEGDFIQRHARAVAQLHDVELIFVKKDEHGVVTKNFQEVVNYSTPGLTERIIYYNPVRTAFKPANKILSDTAYKYFFKKAILREFERSGKPALVHLHVAMRAGLLALWLKEKYELPYILSEHWTGYLENAKPNKRDETGLTKQRRKMIIESAAGITVVSNVLGNAIKTSYKVPSFDVVANVVDTNIFYPVENASFQKTSFIHISSLEAQKNPIEMLKAFQLLKDKGFDFSLTIYGPTNKILENFVAQNGLGSLVVFNAEVPQPILAKDLQTADALVLFSKYETFGCVVIEANACGVPAILSDLDVFKEYVTENKNGMFAKQGDAADLARVLATFIESKNQFDHAEISRQAHEKFSYESVAKEFDTIYRSIILK